MNEKEFCRIFRQESEPYLKNIRNALKNKYDKVNGYSIEEYCWLVIRHIAYAHNYFINEKQLHLVKNLLNSLKQCQSSSVI